MTDVLGRERYRVDGPLGVGAMGTVQLGRDTVLDRAVAIKILADHLAADEAFRRRFLQEARLAARLCHTNIVQVFDAGEDGGCPFIVMEYVDGETVAERLAQGRRFSTAELTALATQLAAGLAHAHARGIVHRDVKPHNVLLRRDGVAKLTDFGIARAVEELGLTEIGTVLGTARFMAPEQAAGRPVGPAADVYGLGALLRHCAAGPLPAELAAVAEAATAADPAARPPASAIHERLVALADAAPPPPAAVLAAAAEAAPTVVAPAPEVVADPDPSPDGVGPTEVRRLPGTTLLPPAPAWWSLERWRRVGDGWSGTGDGWPRFAPLIAAAVLVLLFGLTLHLRGSGGGAATPSSSAPSSTATTAAVSGVPPVAPSPDPAQAAHNLADWLRKHSK